MIALWMIIWCTLGLAAPQETHKKAQDKLRNAQTWYYLARLTENNFFAHQQSEKHYQDIITLLTDDSSAQAQALLKQAEQGLAQTSPRLDNAHDTFRNVLWPIWWITESDPTAEWYSDLYMKAASISWSGVESQIQRFKDPSRIPVVTRAFRNTDLPETSEVDDMTPAERTALLRDEMLSSSDMNPSLYGVYDDLGSRLLEEKWNTLILEPTPNVDILTELANKLNTTSIMILDVNIMDEIPSSNTYNPIVRLDTHAYIFHVPSKSFMHHVFVPGIGQSIRSNNLSAVWWVGGLFFFALLTTFIRFHIIHSKEEKSAHIGSILGFAFLSFVLGSALGEFAGDLSAEFLLDWGTPCYVREWTNFTIPYLPVLIWPLIHGAVVMVGPLVILAWSSVKLRDIIDTFIEDPKLHMSIIAPAAQAGATTWMFHPLIEGVPEKGLVTAAVLASCAIFLSFLISSPLSSVLQGKNLNKPTIMAVVFGTVALLLLLPIGFYRDNLLWAFLVSVVSGIGCWITQRKGGEVSIGTNDPDIVITIDFDENMGTLERPKWLAILGDIQTIEAVEKGHHLHIQGPSKHGASRTLQEISHQIVHKKTIYVSAEESVSIIEPYTLIKKICAKLNIELDLVQQENLGSAMQQGLSQASAVASLFPAFGFVVDTLSDREEEVTFTRARVIEDGARYLEKALSLQQVHCVIIENLHWADSASLEVLSRLMEISSESNIPNFPSFIWNSTILEEENLKEFISIVEEKYTLITINLPPINLEQAQNFLNNCSIFQFSDALIESILQTTDHSIGGFHLVLLLMKEKGLLIPKEKDDKTFYVPIPELTEENIWDKLPNDFKKQELLRLEHLPRDSRFILECASLCGQTCTIDELETGTRYPRQQLLLKLEEIEKISPPIIEDVFDADREFRFVNSLTRKALLETLYIPGQTTLRELGKSVHKSILDDHQKNPFLMPEEVVHHAAAIQNTEDILCSALRDVFIKYASHSSWPEILTLYNKHNTRIQKSTHREYLFDIDTIASKAMRFIGGQNNRNRARATLENLIQTYREELSSFSEKQLFDLFFTLCETIFEEKDKEELQQLIDICEEQQQKQYPAMIHEIFVFYGVFTKSIINNNAPILAELKDIIDRLKTIPAPYSYEYKMLYSSVFQTYANKSWHEQQPPRDATNKNELLDQLFHNLVLPRIDEAKKWKEEINDVQGLAMNYGIRGGWYLYTFRDGAKALEAFDADWEIVEKNNMRADKAGVLNKRSSAHWLLYTNPNTTEKEQHREKAYEAAFASLEIAEKMEREIDFAFTLSHILTMAQAEYNANNVLSKEMSTVLEQLDKTNNQEAEDTCFVADETYWQTKVPGFLKAGIKNTLESLPPFSWSAKAIAALTP